LNSLIGIALISAKVAGEMRAQGNEIKPIERSLTMAGGSKTTTQYTSMPGADEVLGTAKTLFNSGTAWRPNTTSMVTPFSTQTRQGLQGMQNTAQGSAPAFYNNFNRINATAGDGGLNNLQDQQVGRLQGIANANPAQGAGALNNAQRDAFQGYQTLAHMAPAEGTGQLNNVQRNALNSFQSLSNMPIREGTGQLNDVQRQGLDYTRRIASGAEMQNNPYLNEVINRTSNDIGSSTNLMASAAGRYGSGSHQGVLADSIGDMSANLRYQDYGSQQARRDAAIGNLSSIGNQANAQTEADWGRRLHGMEGVAGLGSEANSQYENDMARKLSGLQGVAGLGTQADAQYQNAMGRKLDAIGSLYNAGTQQRQNVLNGTQALQDAYQARLSPYQTMTGVGQQYEGLNSRILQDQDRIFRERQNAMTGPVNWLANLAAAFQGGQQVQKTSETSFDPLAMLSTLARF